MLRGGNKIKIKPSVLMSLFHSPTSFSSSPPASPSAPPSASPSGDQSFLWKGEEEVDESNSSANSSMMMMTLESNNQKRSSAKKISVQTWNIWFDIFQQSRRFDEIIEQTLRNSPDVACFQEVTSLFIQKLKNNVDIMSQYEVSDLTGATLNRYGVLTMVKSQLQPKFHFFEFPTKQGRKLLLTEIQNVGLESEKNISSTTEKPAVLCVGNVHLESLDSKLFRSQQLEICSNIFRNYPNYVLCGDFNFCSYQNYSGGFPSENENMKRILADGADVWSTLHRHEKGYTFHGGVNGLVSNPNEVMRYDRIIAHLQQPGWEANSTIQLVGNSPIRENGSNNSSTQGASDANGFSTPPQASSRTLRDVLDRAVVDVYPSDHYGLIATLPIDNL